jgi:hypothetical protein
VVAGRGRHDLLEQDGGGLLGDLVDFDQAETELRAVSEVLAPTNGRVADATLQRSAVL